MLLVLLGHSCISCSFFSSRTSSSVDLSQALDASAGTLTWTKLSNEPHVYAFKASEPASQELYLTGIRECGGQTSQSAKVLVRQLLVGLKEVKLEEYAQAHFEESPLSLSYIQARLESEPLELACYSLSRSDCHYDLIVWHTRDEANPLKHILDNQTPYALAVQSALSNLIASGDSSL